MEGTEVRFIRYHVGSNYFKETASDRHALDKPLLVSFIRLNVAQLTGSN